MSDKPKVPKGKKGADCVMLLPGTTREMFLDMFPDFKKGDPNALAWGDQQIADMQYQRAKYDLHVIANAKIQNLMEAHPVDVKRGARAILAPDRWEGSSNVSLESRAHAIKGKYGSILSSLMDKYRPLHLGFQRDRSGLKNVIREIFGEATGDQEAAQHAAAWKKLSDYVRKRMVAAGARIGKLEDWGMPQYHDPARVSRVSAEEWADTIIPMLDMGRIARESDLSDTMIRELLVDHIYPSIVTNGASKIDLGKISGKPQGKGLLTRLRQHRFLHFKSADDWINYQEQFGSHDFVATMDDWMRRMSVETAAMEVLGPDPSIGLQHIKNVLRANDQADAISWIDKLYKNVMGEIGTSSVRGAEISSAIRSANVFMHLGNATLSMATDPVFLTLTSRYNDVPAFRALMTQIRVAAKNALGNSEDLRFLSQLGYVNEYATDRLLAAARYTDVTPTKWMGRLSEISVRASWMHNITVAGRAAFSLEYAAALAKDAGKTWAELSPKRILAFQRVGINEADWNRMRSQGVVRHRGVGYMDINAVGRNGGLETATKLGALVNQEMAYAVPTPGAETRAWQNQGLDRGTFSGEAWRFGMEFKSFPITMLMLHARRAMHGQGMNRLAYGGTMIALLFGMGQIATMLKDISKGRDPISLQDDDGSPNWQQIARAAAQGGALGIYGDLLLNDATRFGYSWGEQLAGPTVGLGSDMATLLTQGVKAAFEEDLGTDEWEKLEKELGRSAKRYMPQIWQLRALQDRAVNKALNAMTDGEWEDYMYNLERRREKTTNQTNFWAEDDWLPSRSPEMIQSPAD